MEKLGKSRQDIKREIKNIYERSKKSLRSPQDNERDRKIGEKVSQKTVSKYMRESNMGKEI